MLLPKYIDVHNELINIFLYFCQLVVNPKGKNIVTIQMTTNK